MTDRFNIGPEVRELKLGSTFKTQSSSTSFHTIKYDFKPASVDLNKCATVDVGSNNQVTVTVPNLGSSGTPHTVFKGNQRKYAKECLMIFDKNTGVMTLEKLNHNIQVKKTRSESTNKNLIPPPKMCVENNTMRTQSKTKVSTGSRKNNIIGFVPRGSPMQQAGSPLQTTTTTRSPQRAPAWNANNGQATLPSIPMITDDDDLMPMTSANNSANINMNASSSSNNSSMEFQQPQLQHQLHQKNIQQQQKFQQHQQLPQIQNQQYNNSSNNYVLQNSNSNSSLNIRGANASQSLANATFALEQEIGVLSSSDSSSSDDSSDSGSDSDSEDAPDRTAQQQHQHQHQQQHQPLPQQQQSLPLTNQSFGISNTASLLHDDLQLSESNSSGSEYDF